MGALTPEQRRRRDDVESLIRLAEPFLNLVLAVGDRVSRLIEREDQDYYPPRAGSFPPPVDEDSARAGSES